MKLFGVILWIWFAIAVCVYLWRFVQWIGRRNDPDAERKPSRRQRREAQLEQIQAAATGPSPTEQLFQQAAADRAAGRTSVESDTRSVLPAVSSGGDAGPRATIAELLAGMVWPCELAPVIDTAATDLDHRVVFSTTARPAEVVLPALRENLDAIGYELVERDQWRFTGIGDRGRLGVVVHPDANAVAGRGGAPLSATMPPGSVAVELTALD